MFHFALTSTRQKCPRVAVRDIVPARRVVADVYEAGGSDWALLELAYPVAHRPLVLSAERPVRHQRVYMLGHPSGLPMKYAGPASVRRVDAKGHFVAGLDAFGGNSGSPVFDAASHRVVGILSGGGADYRLDKTGHRLPVTYPEDGGVGERCNVVDDVRALAGRQRRSVRRATPPPRMHENRVRRWAAPRHQVGGRRIRRL